LAEAVHVNGAKLVTAVSTFEVATADSDNSVYRLFKGLNPNLIPLQLWINNDEITDGTDYDLGLYEGNGGAVVSKDVFADGIDLSTARTSGSEVSGLTAVAIENLTKKLFEHAGHTIATKLDSYDLALTANTVGTAAGTVTVRATFAQG
jgi:hypothetical protein